MTSRRVLHSRPTARDVRAVQRVSQERTFDGVIEKRGHFLHVGALRRRGELKTPRYLRDRVGRSVCGSTDESDATAATVARAFASWRIASHLLEVLPEQPAPFAQRRAQ